MKDFNIKPETSKLLGKTHQDTSLGNDLDNDFKTLGNKNKNCQMG